MGARRRWGWLGVVLWSAVLFWQSASSGDGSLFALLPAGSDKVAHAFAYLVLGGLAALATGSRAGGALLAVLYGISDEIHQSFVPGRTPELWDLVADASGALVGAWLAFWLVRNPCRRRREPTLE
ncbi:MAG TPA: VanZ family protein [Trueperaceae bacterium]|nr:VanZ family protein [Trueperaceae bacterium]